MGWVWVRMWESNAFFLREMGRKEIAGGGMCKWEMNGNETARGVYKWEMK